LELDPAPVAEHLVVVAELVERVVRAARRALEFLEPAPGAQSRSGGLLVVVIERVVAGAVAGAHAVQCNAKLCPPAHIARRPIATHLQAPCSGSWPRYRSGSPTSRRRCARMRALRPSPRRRGSVWPPRAANASARRSSSGAPPWRSGPPPA